MRSVSLRTKIVLLISTALAVGFAAYIYVGTDLMVRDKTSYIYDYNNAQLRAFSDKIDFNFRSLVADLTAMGKLAPQQLEAALKARHDSLNTVLTAAPVSPMEFRIENKTGADPEGIAAAWAKLSWKPDSFVSHPTQAGDPTPSGRVPVGVLTANSSGTSAVVFTFVEIDLAELRSQSEIFVHLVNSSGKTFFASEKMHAIESEPEIASVESRVLQSSFESGALDAKIGKENYLVAYQRIPALGITGLIFTPRSEAFRAAKLLALRTMTLGMGILLLAIGFSILLVKSITRRLLQIWRATQRVSEGDFSCRVPVTSGGNDEVTGLALSFNKMADKIDELMLQTAQKARMEKELETAQEVQRMFFPEHGLTEGPVTLFGKALPATECAGDWWHYSQAGKYIVVSIGDVTGHGVPSALVTAACHGAFKITMREFEKIAAEPAMQGCPPPVQEFLRYMNTAVLAAGGTKTSMTAILAFINTETGEMHIANASHRPPYVYKGAGDPNSDPMKSFKVITQGKCDSLGEKNDYDVTAHVCQLEPGDVLFLYTDGLIECENPEGQRISKTTLMKTLAGAVQSKGIEPGDVCIDVLDYFTRFLGAKSSNPDDDTTLVVVTIPKTTQFQAATPPAAEAPAA